MNSKKCSKPIRMWIDGTCFNITQLGSNQKQSEISSSGTATEEKLDENKAIKQEPVSVKFHLPSLYYPKLLSFPNFDLRKLEQQTNTIIKFPKRGQEGLLEIDGYSKDGVTEAQNQIHSVIAKIRDQQPALQFIGVPLHSEEIKSNFERFKSLILEEEINGMDESIFQRSEKLHLTITVFSLLNHKEKSEAIRALDECSESMLKPLVENKTSLKIKVSGINYMKNNSKKVDVLYANAQINEEHGEIELQDVVNSISDFFYERGLVQRYQDNVKLHMTLINTKYRKTENSPKKRWVKRQSFDATKIMEKFKDYHFGESKFDTVHISIISTRGEDGYYKSLATAQF